MLVTMKLQRFLAVLAIAAGLGFAGGGIVGALPGHSIQGHYVR